MAYSFVFLMDPYESLNLSTETSLLLMDELLARGQNVYWLQAEDLSLQNDQPVGRLYPLKSVKPFIRCAPEWRHLNAFDALLVQIGRAHV